MGLYLLGKMQGDARVFPSTLGVTQSPRGGMSRERVGQGQPSGVSHGAGGMGPLWAHLQREARKRASRHPGSHHCM